MSKFDKLSKRNQKMVAELLRNGGNFTRTYMKKKPSISYTSAMKNVNKYMVKYGIKEAYEEELTKMNKQLMEEAMVNKAALLDKFLRVAFFDIGDVVQVKTIEVEEVEEDKETGNKITRKVNKQVLELIDSENYDTLPVKKISRTNNGISVETHSKTNALHELAVIMGMIKQDVKVELPPEKKSEIERLMAKYDKRKNHKNNLREEI